MPEIIPFSTVHYNLNKFNKFDNLVCPAYDVISDVIKGKLKEEVNNFVHLISSNGNETDRYKNAVNKFFGWLLRDVLVIDKKPVFYIIEIEKKSGEVQSKTLGLVGLLRIEDYNHNFKKGELTIEQDINDRYTLLKEAQSSLEPVSCL